MNRKWTLITRALTIVMIITLTTTAFGDTGVQAVPEIQGLVTGTTVNAAGTVTETDLGAWSLTNDPLVYSYPATASGFHVLSSEFDLIQVLLQAAGGSITGTPEEILGTDAMNVTRIDVPESLLDQPFPFTPSITWQQYLDSRIVSGGLSAPVITNKGLHPGVLDPGQVQYSAGYSDQYSGVAGQQTFSKTVALSTANKIADQSNIRAATNIQFIALDTGRATRSEDLLLDGASQARDSSSLILCPFASASPGVIPSFCNIEQAGSAFDTTLTSTVTSVDTRFAGTDATIPVVLNYNIDAKGITLSDGTSSPMTGSVSSYLKVHLQEARNESLLSGEIPVTIFGSYIGDLQYASPDGQKPLKSEDMAYSEASSASGFISRFSKSMSYSSSSSAVEAPQTSVVFTPSIP